VFPMALFSQPVPIAPSPRGRAAVREGDTIIALTETRTVLKKIDAFLRSFGVNSITSADGKIYNALSRVAGAGPAGAIALDHPWRITMKMMPGTPPVMKFGVSFRSDVYDGISWEKSTVTGLFTTDSPTDDDAGWHNAATGFVFLWGQLNDSGVITSIEVKNDQTTLSQTAMPRVKSVSSKQTEFIWVIGYLWSMTSGSTTQWYYRQECNRHITLMYVVVNGVLCKVPFEM